MLSCDCDPHTKAFYANLHRVLQSIYTKLVILFDAYSSTVSTSSRSADDIKSAAVIKEFELRWVHESPLKDTLLALLKECHSHAYFLQYKLFNVVLAILLLTMRSPAETKQCICVPHERMHTEEEADIEQGSSSSDTTTPAAAAAVSATNVSTSTAVTVPAELASFLIKKTDFFFDPASIASFESLYCHDGSVNLQIINTTVTNSSSSGSSMTNDGNLLHVISVPSLSPYRSVLTASLRHLVALSYQLFPIASTQGIRTRLHVLTSSWFIAALFEYLDIHAVMQMDRAMCSHRYRRQWLAGMSDMTLTLAMQRYLVNDTAIAWCVKRNITFKTLYLDFVVAVRDNDYFESPPHGSEQPAASSAVNCPVTTTLPAVTTVVASQCIDKAVTSSSSPSSSLNEWRYRVTESGINALAKQCLALHTLKVHLPYPSTNDYNYNGTAVHDCTQIWLGIIYQLKSVEVIEIAGYFPLKDFDFASIGKNCRQLKHITVQAIGSRTVSSRKGMDVLLKNNQQLLSFSFTSLKSFMPISIFKLLSQYCPLLECVDIAWSTAESYAAFLSFAQNCKNLTSIAISEYNQDPGVLMRYIGMNCHNLERLTLRNDGYIHHAPLTAMESQVLVDDDDWRCLVHSCSATLRTIEIKGDYSVSPDLVRLFAQYCVLLESFYVKPSAMTDEILIELGRCHTLKSVSLYRSRVTDSGIQALVENNHSLEFIDIRNCMMLTDASLIAIADHCPQLETLRCQQIGSGTAAADTVFTKAGERYLLGKCDKLKITNY